MYDDIHVFVRSPDKKGVFSFCAATTPFFLTGDSPSIYFGLFWRFCWRRRRRQIYSRASPARGRRRRPRRRRLRPPPPHEISGARAPERVWVPPTSSATTAHLLPAVPAALDAQGRGRVRHRQSERRRQQSPLLLPPSTPHSPPPLLSTVTPTSGCRGCQLCPPEKPLSLASLVPPSTTK